jgi:outer membrane receptor protein involved in Fe transport
MPYPNHRRHRIAGAALIACCAATGAMAQPFTPSTTAVAAAPKIEEIVVKGQAMQNNAPAYSSTVLDGQQIRDAVITQPEELLRLVPGVVVRALSLGGVVNSVTIRGFSSGAHGGDLGMVVDGIPLNEAMSHADGYADLNIVVPLEISRFEVFRGPVSALYGNFNRGGVLVLQTRRGGDYAQIDASAGSFGTVDVQAAFGGKLGTGRFNGAVQGYKSDGYRPGFDYQRGTLAGRWSVDLAPGSELSLSARLHRGDWDSAGNVTQAQFNGADPYGRDPRVSGDGGLKRYTSARVDYNQLLPAGLKLLSFLYANQQDYSRFFTRPINSTAWSQREETYDRKVAGGGFSINRSGSTFSWVAGAELYRERTDFINFEGTKSRARVNAAVYDRRYDFDSASVFGEAEATLSPLLRPTFGLRWDRFTGACVRNGGETGSDPCAALNGESRFTPKLGLRSTLAPGFDVRASVAEGFALPPGAAKYGAGGAALKATVFRQVEVGVTYMHKRLLRGDLAWYRINSDNEVRTVSPGVFENFGKTQRKGVEASLTLTPLTDFEIGLVYSHTEATVKENASAALVGKLVTGVPKESGTLSLAYRPAQGLGANVELRKAGSFAVTADNTVFYPGYTTVDAGLQYSGQWGSNGNNRWRAYAKVENASDKLYATSTGVTSGQQTYNVAPPRGVRVGVQTDF